MQQLRNYIISIVLTVLMLGCTGGSDESRAKDRPAQASDTVYAELNEMLSERLLQGKAHLYAARFHAQKQQREIERHREATRRASLIGTTFGIVGLLVLLFALYAVAQWRKTQQRNRILAQQITEARIQGENVRNSIFSVRKV